METYNKNTDVEGQKPQRSSSSGRNGRVIGGLFIVLIGVVLLARQMGVDIPRWIFSFESILIMIGLYIGIRHSFRGFAWVIPIMIGAVLLMDDFYLQYDIGDLTWPLIIIGFGFFIILRATKKNSGRKWDARNSYEEETSEDRIDSTVIFGGSKKNIISKNFRGGEVVTVFGGTEINLMQADLNGAVVLELTQVFGGTKLIVPPHWRVWSQEMVAILGGVDDKRPITSNAPEDSNKTLILKGTCMLGGIEIRSY